MLLTKQQLSVLMIVLFSALGLYMNAVEGLQPLKRWASAVFRSTSPHVGCRTHSRGQTQHKGDIQSVVGVIHNCITGAAEGEGHGSCA